MTEHTEPTFYFGVDLEDVEKAYRANHDLSYAVFDAGCTLGRIHQAMKDGFPVHLLLKSAEEALQHLATAKTRAEVAHNETQWVVNYLRERVRREKIAASGEEV